MPFKSTYQIFFQFLEMKNITRVASRILVLLIQAVLKYTLQ